MRRTAGVHGANIMKNNSRKKQLAEQNSIQDLKITEFFAKYDLQKDGKFSRDEFKNVLTEVKQEALNDPAAVVRDDMLDKIYATYDLNHDGHIERTEVLNFTPQIPQLHPLPT